LNPKLMLHEYHTNKISSIERFNFTNFRQFCICYIKICRYVSHQKSLIHIIERLLWNLFLQRIPYNFRITSIAFFGGKFKKI
jgi:hypothetical protein